MKTPVALILMVLVLASLQSFYTMDAGGSDIIYVGGSGAGNHTSIQDALDFAPPGSTIYVYDGEYRDTIIISKSITITGQSMGGVEIMGEEPYGITIDAEEVTLKNITVKRGGVMIRETPKAILQGITLQNGNFRVQTSPGMILKDSALPISEIFFSNSAEARIENITLSNTNSNGININNCPTIRITGNQITVRDYGILMSSSNHALIDNNTISQAKTGIMQTNTNHTTIADNIIQMNRVAGIVLGQWSNNTILQRNTVSGRRDIPNVQGFNISFSHECKLENNTILNNTLGLVLWGGSRHDVRWNNITDNNKGMMVSMSSSNIIHRNIFTGNTVHAQDNGTNTWNLPFPQAGNHWGGYTGEDALWGPEQDMDGWDNIIDSPYNITGGNNRDMLPVSDATAWVRIPPPGVQSFQPPIAGYGIANDTEVRVVFNQPMLTSTTPDIQQTQGNLTNYTFEGWSTTTYTDDTAVWSHTQWDDNNRIRLQVSGAKGLYGLDPAPIQWWFETLDTMPPVVTNVLPANNSTGVRLNAAIRVLFNERMTGTPALTQLSGTASTYTFTGWESLFNHNDTAMWTHTPWVEMETVTLQVSGATDLSGNPMPTKTWSFTTGGTARATGPVSGPTNHPPVIEYSWTGEPDYINIYYSSNAGNTWSLASRENNPDGELHWSPPADGTYHWLAVSSPTAEGTIPPTAGTLPQSGPYIYDTTPPRILSATPQGTASITQEVVLVFTEGMDASVTPVLQQTAGRPASYSFRGYSTTNTMNDTVTWRHSTWTTLDNITLVISGMRDVAGNNASNVILQFETTVDNTPPVANAGPGGRTDTITPFTLNGTRSTDDVGIISYVWRFNYTGHSIALRGPVVEFLFAIPGVYNVELTVMDAGGNTDTSTATVAVNDAPQYGTLTGRAVDTEGQPVAGASVVVYSSSGSRSARTDANGTFAIVVNPGEFTWTIATLHNTADGSGSMSVRGIIDLGDLTLYPKTVVQSEETDSILWPVIFIFLVTIVLIAFLYVKRLRR